ncbi:MAG: hypothetical protein ABFD08_09210 [Syntrophomonas sp.]
MKNGYLDKLLMANGIVTIFFIILHSSFWTLFAWKSELIRLSPINSHVMQLLNIALICVLLLVAFCSFFRRSEILGSRLGKTLLIGWASIMYVRSASGLFFGGFTGESLIMAVFIAAYATLSFIPGLKARY